MKVFDKTEEISMLRKIRNELCFRVINRGKAWYDMLTLEQEAELKEWYKAWLNVTETGNIPVTPSWINNKLSQEEDLL